MRSWRRSKTHGCVGAGTGWDPAPITLHDEHGLARRRARLREGAFLRRIRVRFLLGAGVRAARSRLLPEARDRRAVHARDRRHACWCAPASTRSHMRSALDRGHPRIRGRAQLLVDPRPVRRPSDDRAALRRTAGWIAATTCSFTGHNQRLSRFRALPRRLHRRGTQERAQRERRRVVEDGVTCETVVRSRARPRDIDEIYDLHRDTFLRHGTRAVSHARVLPRAAASARRTLHGQARASRRRNRSPRRCSTGAATRSTAATGARGNSSTACISRLCYHQGIEFCIERGIARFEPGTQGEHKVSRGFVPAEDLVDALDRRSALPARPLATTCGARARTWTNTRAEIDDTRPVSRCAPRAPVNRQMNKTITWLDPGRRPRVVSAARPGAG